MCLFRYLFLFNAYVLVKKFEELLVCKKSNVATIVLNLSSNAVTECKVFAMPKKTQFRRIEVTLPCPHSLFETQKKIFRSGRSKINK